MVYRDFYGVVPAGPVTPPILNRAYFTSNSRTAITLEFDQPVIWLDSLAGQFYLDDAKDMIATGSVKGHVITLRLKTPSKAKKITYLKEMAWNQNDLLFGVNGIAALTFCDVPLNSRE